MLCIWGSLNLCMRPMPAVCQGTLPFSLAGDWGKAELKGRRQDRLEYANLTWLTHWGLFNNRCDSMRIVDLLMQQDCMPYKHCYFQRLLSW